MFDAVGVNAEGLSGNDEIMSVDREYFKRHRSKKYYIRERLLTENDIHTPYVLVLNVPQMGRIRLPRNNNHISNGELRHLKRYFNKKFKKINATI